VILIVIMSSIPDTPVLTFLDKKYFFGVSPL